MPETTLDIIERCKQDDKDAFRELVEANQSYAFSLAFRMLCNEDDAKEVVQDSFIRVWRHISKYKKEIKFTTWLYKIVLNLCYDKIDSIKRRRQLFQSEEETSKFLLTANETDIEREFTNRELASCIKGLSEKLSAKQQAVFVLRDLQGLETNEISEILDMPLKNIKSNLCLARKEIREKLIKLKLVGGLEYEL